jgi:hypothetical protein
VCRADRVGVRSARSAERTDEPVQPEVELGVGTGVLEKPGGLGQVLTQADQLE